MSKMYNDFKKELLKNGVADSRVESLAQAVNQLHTACSFLDLDQRANFFEKYAQTIDLVDSFGKAEEYARFKDFDDADDCNNFDDFINIGT
tara:strand:+ start:115 stop:387 length:273 start_codon:yes stop_codon:yes gene_type:complete